MYERAALATGVLVSLIIAGAFGFMFSWFAVQDEWPTAVIMAAWACAFIVIAYLVERELETKKP